MTPDLCGAISGRAGGANPQSKTTGFDSAFAGDAGAPE